MFILGVFDDDHLIPTFGFGDVMTTNKSVFPFFQDRPCHSVKEVLARYEQITPHISLSGPTSFAPLIKEAIKIVQENNNSYHILLIIADGQVSDELETKQAIIDASAYPLSIIMVGVGDGPWHLQREFDDSLPARAFDNFQFVCLEDVMLKASSRSRKKRSSPEAIFAMNALMEIPDQYRAIKKLRYLSA